MSRVCAIVVTFNGKKWYDRCFGSLRDSAIPVEIIVVDNASSDNTVEYIRGRFPFVHLIESKENLGFAKANNIGIRYAIDHSADYCFLLNQDAWIEKDTVEKLLQTFEDNEKVGIASPMHLDGNYTGLDWGFVNYLPSAFISDSFMQKAKPYYAAEFVNAAAWLISADCIHNVGGFDTLLFFHYGEDGNYCQRVLYHGYQIIINTTTTICHDRGERKETENEYRQKVLEKNPFISNKLLWGDINCDVDISGLIKQYEISSVKSLLKFSKRRFMEHKRMISVLHDIEQSRIINKRPGASWL